MSNMDFLCMLICNLLNILGLFKKKLKTFFESYTLFLLVKCWVIKYS